MSGSARSEVKREPNFDLAQVSRVAMRVPVAADRRRAHDDGEIGRVPVGAWSVGGVRFGKQHA